MTGYKIRVKYGYRAEFVFRAATLREAGWIADTFLNDMIEPAPDEITINIEPYKREVEEERNEREIDG